MNPIVEQIKLLANQYGVSQDKIAEILSDIIIRAYNKQIPDQVISVSIDIDSGKVISQKHFKVIEDAAEGDYDDFMEIPLSEAKKHGDFKVGDDCKVPFDIFSFFKKHEILTIMQVFKQKLLEINNQRVFVKWSPSVGTLISCIIEKHDKTKGFYIIDLDDGNFGFLSKNECIPGEELQPGKKYQFYIKEVKEQSKGWPIILSRADARFVLKLLEQEVPEIASGEIEVKLIERIAGFKTKVAVTSANTSYDAASVVVGPKGSRIKAVSDLLNGEKIEIIKYVEDNKQLLLAACGSNNLVGINYVKGREEGEQDYATLITTEKLLPVIIGKKGNNIKLISKLINCSIDINTVEEAREHGIQYEEINSPEVLNAQTPHASSTYRKPSFNNAAPSFNKFRPNNKFVNNDGFNADNILEDLAAMSKEELEAKFQIDLGIDESAHQTVNTVSNNEIDYDEFDEADEFENNDLADAFADEIANIENKDK